MAGVLYRLGRLCANRAVVVVAVWLGLVVAVQLTVGRVGAQTTNDLSLPGTDSQQATDLLASRFPPQQNGNNPIVFHVTHGQAHRRGQQEGDQRVRQGAAKQPHVSSAPNPFSQAAPRACSQGQADRVHAGPARHRLGDLTEEIADDVFDATEPGREGAGIEVAAGGSIGSSCPSRRPRAASSSASSPR